MPSVEIQKYIKAVGKSLHCDRRTSKRILDMLAEDIAEYLADHPDAAPDDLRHVFGEPEDYAAESISGLDRSRIYRTVTHKQNRSLIFLILSALLLVCAVMTIFLTIHIHQGAVVSYSVEIVDYGVVVENVEEYTGPVEGLVIIPENVR